MITSFESDLQKWIAWDGSNLTERQRLGDDLSFRRFLAEACSKLDLSLSDEMRSKFISERTFFELLERAIRVASDATLPGFVEAHLVSAPTSVSLGPSPTPARPAEDARELWTARLRVFEQLTSDGDFLQFLREFVQRIAENREQGKGWWRRVCEWGEEVAHHLPKMEGEHSAVARESPGVGSVLAIASAPLLTSLAFVTPIVGGAWYISDHIIEKQSEVRTRETYVRTDRDSYQYIERVTDLTDELKSVQGRVDEIAQHVEDDRKQIGNVYEKLVELNGKLTDRASPQKITLSVDSWPDRPFKAEDALTTNLYLKPLSGNFTVGLRNAPTDDQRTNVKFLPADKKDSDPTDVSPETAVIENPVAPSFRIDHDVHQLTMTTGLVPAVDAIRGEGDKVRPSFLLEFEEGQFSQRVLVPAENTAWKDAVIQLCNSSQPFRFLVRHDANVGQPEECAGNLPGSHFVTVTATPSYDKELQVFLTLDTASRRKFLVAGSRHIVVQVSPR